VVAKQQLTDPSQGTIQGVETKRRMVRRGDYRQHQVAAGKKGVRDKTRLKKKRSPQCELETGFCRERGQPRENGNIISAGFKTGKKDRERDWIRSAAGGVRTT